MAKERFVLVDESKKKRGCPKGGWPKKADAGKEGMVEYRVVKEPTQPSNSSTTTQPLTTPKKRGRPKKADITKPSKPLWIINSSKPSMITTPKKRGRPRKADIGEGEEVEYRVVHAHTKSTTPKKKRGCPKGGWPKMVDKGEKVERVTEEVEEVTEEVEDMEENEAKDVDWVPYKYTKRTKRTTLKKKRGCPKGGWPKNLDKGEQVEVEDQVEDEFEEEEMENMVKPSKITTPKKRGRPRKVDVGEGEEVEYRVIHAPTKPTTIKKKRGCPKGGWPKKGKGEQVEAEEVVDLVEDEFEVEEIHY